jgi:hypothetical protein
MAEDARPVSVEPWFAPTRPDMMATESGRSSEYGSFGGARPLYRSGSFGGDLGIAAERRCRSSSCSLAMACDFLFPLPRSPDFVRRSRIPRLERRAWFFPDSGITASLSVGESVPALGVRGLLVETMADGS